MIAGSYDANGNYSGLSFTFDANGNSTGQTASLTPPNSYSTTATGQWPSWLGTALDTAYSLASGAATSVTSNAISYAATFAAMPGGNQSGQGTAIQQVQSNQAQDNQEQLPSIPPVFGNLNMIELSTDKSPDYVFQHYLQTFVAAIGSNNEIMTFSGELPVTGSGQKLTITLRAPLRYGQGPFSVLTERFDPVAHTIAAVTLNGHPLAGWRYWRVYSIGTNDLMVETGAYDGSGPGLTNYVGYFITQGTISKSWRGYLEYIKKDLGAQQILRGIQIGGVPGTANPNTMLNGLYDYLGDYTNYILNNVCQSQSCN